MSDWVRAKIENAPKLDFGDIFNDSIALFKKSWLHGLIMQLILIAIAIPVVMIFYFPIIALAWSESIDGRYNEDAVEAYLSEMPVGMILFYFLAILAIALVSLAIKTAFFRMLKKLDENEEVKTGDLFYFFKKEYVGKMILMLLVTLGLSLLFGMFCGLPLIYAVVPMSFFNIFFAFNPEWSVGEMITNSFVLGNKKWLISFGLIVISSILASVIGFLLCGIGILVTSAFTYHPVYVIYKKVIGFDN